MKYIEYVVSRKETAVIVVAVPDDFDMNLAMRWNMKPLIDDAVDNAEPWDREPSIGGNFEIESTVGIHSEFAECHFDPARDEPDATLTAEQIEAAFAPKVPV